MIGYKILKIIWHMFYEKAFRRARIIPLKAEVHFKVYKSSKREIKKSFDNSPSAIGGLKLFSEIYSAKQ